MSDTDQATAAATERATQYKDATDKLRERSDAAAKTLGALGTAALSAIGIAKFSDVFPAPPGNELAIAAVILGFIAMMAAEAAFTFRMLKANRPFVTDSDAQQLDDADGDERGIVDGIYVKAARHNGLGSLRAYEARGQRWGRIADRSVDDNVATKLKTLAERIRAESDATQARAGLVISRRRMSNALRGLPALFFALIFLAGLFAFGLGADRLDSERSARLASYKACADASTAGVMKLPAICNGVTTPPATPNPATKRRDALLAQYTSCLGTAVKNSVPLATCDSIKTQLEAAVK